MEYTTYKALHIIFMVTWFAGLFYIVRLFIYHREAIDKQEPERSILMGQFRIMERRLWYAITWPSAVLCTGFGLYMIWCEPVILKFGYFHLKLLFVALLIAYQLLTHRVYLSFQNVTASKRWSSMALRFYNEFPTVVLIAVVFLIIRKDSLSWLSGLLGIIGVAVLLTLAIKWYQRVRR